MRFDCWYAVACAAVVGLAACGGGGGGSIAPPARTATPSPAPSGKTVTGSVTLRIAIPAITAAARVRRGPAYVSPSTQSMSIAVNGATPVNVNLTTGSPDCVAGPPPACSVTIAAPTGNDTFVVALYDGTGGTGNVLATKMLTQTVLTNATNMIPLVLNGVVNTIGVTPATPTVPAGVATSMPVIVNAYDAQSNIIVGPGNYADANGNALTITLAAVQSTPTVQTPYTAGSATLSATTLTGPSTALTMSYNGYALLSTQFTATVSGGATVAPASATLNVTPAMYEYPAVANGDPYSLAVGVDKQIWVTLFGITAVEHFAPPAPGATSLNATTFTMPDTSNQWALGIAPGSDGNMWIASWGTEIFVCSVLGSCSIINVYEADHPEYVIDGGDGNMYVNQSYYTGPYQYGITSQAFIQDYGDIGGGHRQSIGPDGRVWSAGGQAGCCYTPYIVALPTSTSGGGITLVNMGNDTTNAAAGPDGNIWYVQNAAGMVGHLTSLTSTSVTGPSFSTPAGAAGGLRGLTAGPDGNMYFTEPTANNIGRVLIGATTTAGITEYPVPSANAGLIDLIAGPDGNIWFVESSTNQIGKLAL